MPLSYIILMIVSILILLGFAHRVLDRLGLSDMAALVFIIAIIVGSFIPDVKLTHLLSINIGGAIVPLILSIYVFLKADSKGERARSVLGFMISGIIVYLLGIYLPAEPASIIIEPIYVYAIVCGLVSYAIGRSRKAAFISGVMGMIVSDLIQWSSNMIRGIPGTIRIGGAGFLDAVVISPIIAVLLVELIGETREKIQGGTSQNKSQETKFSRPFGEVIHNDQKDKK